MSFAWGSLLFIGLATIWKLVCLWQEGWEKAFIRALIDASTAGLLGAYT